MAQTSYLQQLADQYYRNLQGQGRPGTNTSRGAPTGAGNPLAAIRGIPLPPVEKMSRLEGAIGPQSRVGRVIDVLSRPGYAVGNTLKNTTVDPLRDIADGTRESSVFKAMDRGDNIINTLFNATVGSAASGLAGRSKVLPHQPVLEDWKPETTGGKVGKFATGLGIDIALDPLTYIPGGVYVAGLKKIPGAAKGIEALKKSGTLAKDAVTPPPVPPTPIRATPPGSSPTPAVPSRADIKDAAQGKLPTPARSGMLGLDRNSIKAVAAQQADNAPEPFSIRSFNTAIQQSVRDAASTPRTVDGKKVYSFKRLDNLYVKPKPAPKDPKPADSMTSKLWAQANAENKVTYTDDGKLIFSSPDDAAAMTLAQFLGNAQRTSNTAQLRDVKTLWTDSAGGASRVTPAADEVAQRAARPRAGGARAERIKGAEAAARLSKLRDNLDPEDYTYLVNARSEASYKARRNEILSRVHSPVESSTIADAPVDSPLRALLGEEVAPTAIPERTPLNPTNPNVQRAISKSTTGQFRPEGYKYRSGLKDNARTNVKVGKGRAIADGGFNKRAQYALWRSLIGDASNALKALGKNAPSGAARGDILRQRVLVELDEAEAVLRSRGIEPILGESHTGIALSLGDVLHALDLTDSGRSVMLNNIFSIKNAQVAPTALMDAAQTLLEAMKQAGVRTTADIPDFLRTMRATSGEADNLLADVGRTLVRDPGGNYAGTADAAARRTKAGQPVQGKGIVRRETERVWNNKTKKYEWVSKTNTLGGKELNDAANTILKALTSQRVVTELVKRNITNSARFNAQMGYEVQRISGNVIDEFFTTWLRPTTSTGEAIAAYRAIPKAVNIQADAANAMPASRNASREVVDSEIGEELAEDLTALRNVEAVIRADTIGSKKAAAQRAHEDFAAEAVEALPAAKMIDMGDNIDAAINHSILRSFFPFLSKTPESFLGRLAQGADYIGSKFIAQVGHATLRPALTEQRGVVRNLANYWRDQLTQVHKVFPRAEDLQPVFVQFQQGKPVRGNFSPEQNKAIAQLEHLVSTLFENSDRANAATGIFFRNAMDLDHINGKFAQMKLPEHIRFDVDSAAIQARQTGEPIQDILANQWRSWKIDDPIDFIARMQHAATSAIGDASMAREAARIAKSKGLMSMKPREGYVKISDSSGKSIMARYMPEGAYYHKDIVDEMRSMDEVLRQSLTMDSPFGMFVHRYLDPFLNMWKAGMTIYRPGHHVRNLVGDSGLSFLADGLAKAHQPRGAMVVMGMRGNYDDYSALRALQGLPPDSGAIKRRRDGSVDEAALLRGDQIVAHIEVKGQKIPLTAKTIHDYVRSKGMLPDFVSGEDLVQAADNSSQSIRAIQQATSVFGGRVRGAAGKVSESRDDFVRLTHFIQIIEKNKNKFATQDQLMQFAVDRVRKWHPDGTDLTAFESKVMRRVFPFYSWSKKSMPLIVEAMVMHPGRIMQYPKAMFNMAQSNGIDLNAISDPFPEDQLFPHFLEDEMTGPIAKVDGNYVGINPGLPHVDIINQMVGAPSESIMGMLSPFIKAPIELKTGTRIDTGSPISDTSEYVASNIPGVAQANSLTGTDLLGSLLTGDMTPLRTVDKGNREQFDPNTIINFLSGLGINNMSKPSYINYAEIEQRNAAIKAAGG